VPNLVAEGRLPLTKENQIEPIPILGFKFPLHPSDLVSELKVEEDIKMGSYDHFLRMSRRAREAPIVLVNTFRELEEECFVTFEDLLLQATNEQQVCTFKNAKLYYAPHRNIRSEYFFIFKVLCFHL